MDAGKEVVKYFKYKTAVHGLLDKAREHVEVSSMVLQLPRLIPVHSVQGSALRLEGNGCVVRGI